MSNTEVQNDELGYGYASDEVKQSSFFFGLNTDVKMIKFDFIPNGGKDGAEQEALDIVFLINGTERSYRRFPVTHGYDSNNNKITDRKAPEFKEAFVDFNATITHVLHAFVDDIEKIKVAFARPISGFKEFVTIAKSLLPTNFAEIPLHLFMQYQWQPRAGANRTYLDIPQKMKYGAWLKKAIPGEWKEVRVPNADDKTTEALYYVNTAGAKDEAGNFTEKHPFIKNGWFMNSAFANQQRDNSAGGSPAASTANTTAAANATQAEGAAKASSW